MNRSDIKNMGFLENYRTSGVLTETLREKYFDGFYKGPLGRLEDFKHDPTKIAMADMDFSTIEMRVAAIVHMQNTITYESGLLHIQIGPIRGYKGGEILLDDISSIMPTAWVTEDQVDEYVNQLRVHMGVRYAEKNDHRIKYNKSNGSRVR